MQKKVGFENPIFCLESENVTATHYKRKRPSCMPPELSEKDEADLYYREILHEGQDKHSNNNRQWTFRFFSLLLLLFISTAVKFVSNLYKLV
ncbi:hypothetical protein AVEN_213757-1, partial [Araneus ventricosus]